jgi:hypothetical protein
MLSTQECWVVMLFVHLGKFATAVNLLVLRVVSNRLEQQKPASLAPS